MMTVKQNPIVSNWNLDHGYNGGPDDEDKIYPIRVFNARPKSSLYVILRLLEDDLENHCHGFVHGFRIYLNMPGEVFGVSQKYFQVPLIESVKIAIKPTLITTSAGLHRYHPAQRKCFLSSERQLRFFKFYTQSNCEVECLANFTASQCDCVKFSMPSTKIIWNDIERWI